MPSTRCAPPTACPSRWRGTKRLDGPRRGSLMCWAPIPVAEDDSGTVGGLTQALIREGRWVLSLLGVATRCQERGVGKRLLDRSLEYGSAVAAGMILCSRDPRAMRRYARAGFDLHPCLTAMGRVDRTDLSGSDRVREGSVADLDFVARLDRYLRGGPHGPDLDHLLGEGCRLLIVDEQG